MAEKLLIIISTSDPEKAETGMMYAVNALRNQWMEEVKLFFFGPAEKLLTQNTDIQEYLGEYQAMNGTAIACEVIANRENISDKVNELGVKVDPVGATISKLLHEGYIPMVW